MYIINLLLVLTVFTRVSICFIPVVPNELYDISTSESLLVSHFLNDPSSSSHALGGSTTKPKIALHTTLSTVKWVTKLLPENPPKNADLSLRAEVIAYKLLKAITPNCNIPLVPVFYIVNEQNDIVGNAQPLVEDHRHERLDESDLRITEPTEQSLASFEILLLQHWLDVYLDDFDDNYGNWLVVLSPSPPSSPSTPSSPTIPLRIDHGFALLDDVTGKKMKPYFKRHKRVFSDVFCYNQGEDWKADMFGKAIKDIASLLRTVINKPLLRTLFAEFLQSASSPKLDELVDLYYWRAQNFESYAASNQEVCPEDETTPLPI